MSSRTLRHYDALGLVPASYIGSNGYRYYDQAELERLQEVLLLRELGLGLSAIGHVLDGTADRIALLREHHATLVRERDRLDRLVTTVARTIATKEVGGAMNPEELFEGFDFSRQEGYEAELIERYGDRATAAITESKARMHTWSKSDAARIKSGLADLDVAYTLLLDAGAAPDDESVQGVAAAHFRWVCQFWTPDAESFAGLGDLYVDNPEFKARYEGVRPGLAYDVRDAMAAYARIQLR